MHLQIYERIKWIEGLTSSSKIRVIPCTWNPYQIGEDFSFFFFLFFRDSRDSSSVQKRSLFYFKILCVVQIIIKFLPGQIIDVASKETFQIWCHKE